jgi:hypothetical protein
MGLTPLTVAVIVSVALDPAFTVPTVQTPVPGP